VSHANAALAPIQRLRIGKLIVDEGWPVAHAARLFHVSWPTAKRWAEGYAAMGLFVIESAPGPGYIPSALSITKRRVGSTQDYK
jgi:hypothetical protein